MKIAVYIHVFCVNRWELILQEIVSSIVHSGLYERCKYVKICMQGEYEPELLTYIIGKYSKIYTYNLGQENNFEWGTLQLLWKERNSYDYVLYLHTKSVSSPEVYNTTTHNWRRYMLWVNVRHYTLHLHALSNGKTVSGTLYLFDKIIAGNFWWTTKKYVSTLQEPLKYKESTKEKHRNIFSNDFMQRQPVDFIEGNRWGCETWICDSKNVRISTFKEGDPKTYKDWDN